MPVRTDILITIRPLEGYSGVLADAHLDKGSDSSSQPPHLTALPYPPCDPTMADKSQRRRGGGRVVPTLNMVIDSLNIAKEVTNNTPVNPVFCPVATLLTMIRVSSLLFRDEMCGAHT